jgi:hypothetical protein
MSTTKCQVARKATLEHNMAIAHKFSTYIFMVLLYSVVTWAANFLLMGMSMIAADSHDNSGSTVFLLNALFYIYKVLGFPLLTAIELFKGSILIYYPLGPILNFVMLIANSMVAVLVFYVSRKFREPVQSAVTRRYFFNGLFRAGKTSKTKQAPP